MSDRDKLKPFPIFETDDAAETFVEKADLSEFDFSGFRPAHFEFESEDAQINMRIPRTLLEAVKRRAKSRGIPYTRYIRELLQSDIGERQTATHDE